MVVLSKFIYLPKYSYKEFCDMILPKKYSIAKLISERYPPLHFTGFSYDTKSKLIDMFNAMVSAEKSNDNYRTILSTSPSTSAFDCFNMLKKDYCYGIYKDDIVNFMEENGKFMNSYEIESLIERLDKNQDGLISYNEFLAEVSPRH